MDIPPISSLPNELLLKVFYETLTSPRWDLIFSHPWYMKPYVRVAVITHVCRRWRNIVINTPDFWTTIDSTMPMHCFDTFLQRSQPHLLTINTHSERTQHADSERLLLQLPRCRSLLVDHGTPFYEQLFVDTHPWHQYAQTLESLSLEECNAGNPYDRLPSLFQRELSALTSLTWYFWRRNSLAGLRCPYLTELVFRSQVALPWTQWLDFLRSTPLLQILDLGDAVNAEPLHPASSGSLMDLAVHLPHLSALRLYSSQTFEEELGESGELALFNRLEFPSHTTIDIVTQQMATYFRILETIQTRLARPLPRSRPETTPTIIAIDCCDDSLDISVWHTSAVPLVICRQWQETLSHPPPISLRLICHTGLGRQTTDILMARLYACAAQLLDRVYPLHLLETLVFKHTPSMQQTAEILQAFRQVFKKMTNVRTLHLQGYRVDELLKSILSQSAASPHASDDGKEAHMQDDKQGISLFFPSLRNVTLKQHDASAGISPPRSPDSAQIPSIDQIVNMLQELGTQGECHIELVHICAKPSFDPLNKPTKCGGSCFDISDPLRPELLPLLGSDSLSTKATYLRKTTFHGNGSM